MIKCYDYVLLYVDDALVVSENAESILRNELGRYFELKEVCSNSSQECGGISDVRRQQVLENAK